MSKNSAAALEPLPTIPIPRFIPVTEWPKYFPWPTVTSLRWMIFNASTNGMDRHKVIRRVGRRVLVDPEAFNSWIDSNPGTTGGAA